MVFASQSPNKPYRTSCKWHLPPDLQVSHACGTWPQAELSGDDQQKVLLHKAGDMIVVLLLLPGTQ
jgi:hypothetical protein